jgi:hypothetical protein
MWVSDYCLMPSGQFFSYISWQEQVTFNDNDGVCYLTDQHAELDLYSACSLKQQSAGRHIVLHGHIILLLLL